MYTKVTLPLGLSSPGRTCQLAGASRPTGPAITCWVSDGVVVGVADSGVASGPHEQLAASRTPQTTKTATRGLVTLTSAEMDPSHPAP